MSKNPILTKILSEQAYEYLQDRKLSHGYPNPNASIDEDEKVTLVPNAEGVLLNCRRHLENKARSIIILRPAICHGYDFEEQLDGKLTEDIFEQEVKDSQKRSKEHEGLYGRFIGSGVVDNRYGWYLLHF